MMYFSWLSVQALHVVGRKHAGLPGALDRAEHPSLVDALRVNDHVSVAEGDLIVILSGVIVQRSIHSLLDTTCVSETQTVQSNKLCVCVCVVWCGERERVGVGSGESERGECVGVVVCGGEREREGVWGCVRERERESGGGGCG